MCLKESTAISGRSSFPFPRWWRGWANLTPSAVKNWTWPRSPSSSRFTRSLYSWKGFGMLSKRWYRKIHFSLSHRKLVIFVFRFLEHSVGDFNWRLFYKKNNLSCGNKSFPKNVVQKLKFYNLRSNLDPYQNVTDLKNCIILYLNTFCIVRAVEEDEEGNALLGELLGVLEGDLPHQGVALLLDPTLHNIKYLIKVVLVKKIPMYVEIKNIGTEKTYSR